MFFNPRHTPQISHRHLPHWRQEGVIYYVTFRLADSIPIKRLQEWKERRQLWEAGHHAPLSEDGTKERDQLFSEQIDHWLDQGSGSCLLANPIISKIVSDSLAYFDGSRYVLDAYVVMPNHVHLILEPKESYSLEKILHSIKSYTAKKINRHARRTGQFWQEESYDRIVRSPEELSHFREYIRRNPEVAGVKLPEDALYLME